MKKYTLPLLLAGAVLFPVAHADAAAEVGDVVKCPDVNTVYYLGDDGVRYAFPNERVYKTWYDDFSEVKTVECGELGNVPFGGLVKYRAGARLVKTETSPRVYYVGPNGNLRPITSPQQAERLFGEDWAQRVDDIPEFFLTEYKIETELGDAELPEGLIILDTDGNIFRVDDSGDAIEVDDVTTDEEEEDVLRRLAVPFNKVKFEVRKRNLLSEGNEARLREVLQRFKIEEEDGVVRIRQEIRLREHVDGQVLSDQREAAAKITNAMKLIERVREKINDREVRDIDVTEENAWLDEAERLVDAANVLYEQGDYKSAEDTAEDARDLARDAIRGFQVDDDIDEEEKVEEEVEDKEENVDENEDNDQEEVEEQNKDEEENVDEDNSGSDDSKEDNSGENEDNSGSGSSNNNETES